MLLLVESAGSRNMPDTDHRDRRPMSRPTKKLLYPTSGRLVFLRQDFCQALKDFTSNHSLCHLDSVGLYSVSPEDTCEMRRVEPQSFRVNCPVLSSSGCPAPTTISFPSSNPTRM